MLKSHILVTGGAGYIGSHCVRELVQQHEKVVILDNLSTGHRAAARHTGAELVVGDMGNSQLVANLFAHYQFDAVMHFAANISVPESVADPLKYYVNNTAAPLTLLQAMQRHGCKKFIFSSTCATYGNPQYNPIDEIHPQNPINPYGMSKLMLERVLFDCAKAWGLQAVCLRYFNASGAAEDGMLGACRDEETALLPLVLRVAAGLSPSVTVLGTDYDTADGSGVRDYIHVLDLATAHHAALKYLRQGGETTAINLGTGLGTSVLEIIQKAESITGKKINMIYGPRRVGDPAAVYANPKRAIDLLGWKTAHNDVAWQLETAWKFLTGPRGGKF